MKKLNSEFTELYGYKQAQIIYVLYVLENFTDKNNKLSQVEIALKVKELRGETADVVKGKEARVDTRAIGRALRTLKDVGYNIHGVNVTGDDDIVHQESRGKIWLEKEISDEKLQILIDTILFSNYIGKAEAEDLIDGLISLGGPSIRNKSANTRINGGRVYHQENVEFFKELKTINEAMSLKEPKKISFMYAQYKYVNNAFVLAKEHEHIVSPYHYVSRKGNYYLIGYNHKQNSLWHYRLDYVKNVKILKENAKNRNDTELKGKNIGEYVMQHPYMYAGNPEAIEVRVNADKVGIMMENFGADYTRIANNADTIDFRIYCTEIDAFHWAMQYGSHIEILKPQSLREKIRKQVENMSMKYMYGDGDRYAEAISKVKIHGRLDLTGIKYGNRTQHEELTNVREVILSDNKISDISFLKKYKNLSVLSIKNNPITDLTPLENLDNVHILTLENLPIKDLSSVAKMKNLRCLYLSLGRNVDYKAINDMTNLKMINMPENDSYHLDWDYIPKYKQNLEIKTSPYKPKEDAKIGGNNTSAYPLIVIKEALGYNVKLIVSENEILEDVEKMLNSLPAEEKEVAYLLYKFDYNNVAISEKLNVSLDEVKRLKKEIKKKITHASYNEKLIKYVDVLNPNSSHAVQKIKELMRGPQC